MVNEQKTDKGFEALKQHLKKNRIGFRCRYQEPLYRQVVLEKLGIDDSKLHCANAEAVAGKVLGLPNHPGLTRAQLDRVIEVLHSF